MSGLGQWFGFWNLNSDKTNYGKSKKLWFLVRFKTEEREERRERKGRERENKAETENYVRQFKVAKPNRSKKDTKRSNHKTLTNHQSCFRPSLPPFRLNPNGGKSIDSFHQFFLSINGALTCSNMKLSTIRRYICVLSVNCAILYWNVVKYRNLNSS